MPPVTYVALENVSKALGTRTLLSGVTGGVTEGARIGVVGRNGGGKTTLVRVLTGLEPADSGRVIRYGGLTIGLLAQIDDLDESSTEGSWTAGHSRNQRFVESLMDSKSGGERPVPCSSLRGPNGLMF